MADSPYDSCSQLETDPACGWAAVQALVDNEKLVLDPRNLMDTGKPLIVDVSSFPWLNKLRIGEVENEGDFDIAHFTCKQCDKCVNVVDASGLVFVQDAPDYTESSPNNPHFTINQTTNLEAIDFLTGSGDINTNVTRTFNHLLDNNQLAWRIICAQQGVNPNSVFEGGLSTDEQLQDVFYGVLASYTVLKLQADKDGLPLPTITPASIDKYQADFSTSAIAGDITQYVLRHHGAIRVLDQHFIDFIQAYMELRYDDPYMVSTPRFMLSAIMTYNMFKHALYTDEEQEPVT